MPEKDWQEPAPVSICAVVPPPSQTVAEDGARTALRCAFCGATDGVVACEFAVWNFVPSVYAWLGIGDKVHRITEQMTRPAATVVGLQAVLAGVPMKWDAPWRGCGWPVKVIVLLRKSSGKEIEREVYARSPVRVLRDENCDAPACYRHRCERGPGATFCADHWTSLEYSWGSAREFRASAAPSSATVALAADSLAAETTAAAE